MSVHLVSVSYVEYVMLEVALMYLDSFGACATQEARETREAGTLIEECPCWVGLARALVSLFRSPPSCLPALPRYAIQAT